MILQRLLDEGWTISHSPSAKKPNRYKGELIVMAGKDIDVVTDPTIEVHSLDFDLRHGIIILEMFFSLP